MSTRAFLHTLSTINMPWHEVMAHAGRPRGAGISESTLGKVLRGPWNPPSTEYCFVSKRGTALFWSENKTQ